MYCEYNPCLLPKVIPYLHFRICPVNFYEVLVKEDDEIDKALALRLGQKHLLHKKGFEEFSVGNLEPFYRLFSEEQNYDY